MFAVVEMIEFPDSQDPELERVELYQSLEEALTRTSALRDDIHPLLPQSR